MTSMLRFTKGHGTGNDFVLYADPDGERTLNPTQIAALCDRRFGVGADGVIRAVKSRHLPEGRAALEEDNSAEWFMDYYNADGFPAEMCGNGIRLFVAYLLKEGLIDLRESHSVVLGTRGGVRDVQRSGNGFQVDLGRWRLDDSEPLVIAPFAASSNAAASNTTATSSKAAASNKAATSNKGGGPRPGLSINVGNPHIVIALPDDNELDALDLSHAPHVDPAPNGGTNVEFVVPRNPLVIDGVGHIRMRVYERGSGETLSCGTGAAAAALATRYWAGPTAPNNWRVDVPGGTLGVRMFPTQDGEHVGLSGPIEFVFDGDVAVKE